MAGSILLTAAVLRAQDYIPLGVGQLAMPPASRNAQELKVDVGVGSPGALDEIALRLMKAKKPGLTAQQLVQVAESTSESIQNGAGPASAGTTSLVSKAVSSILGLSEEAGAVTSSTSGSTTTLTANIAQIADLMAPAHQHCYLISDGCSFGGVLVRGAYAAVSINSSTTSTPASSALTSSALTALGGQGNPVFGGFILREDLLGRKNQKITDTTFQAALEKIGLDPTTKLGQAAGDAALLIEKDPAYPTALQRCVESFLRPAATGAALHALREACINSFVEIAKNATNATEIQNKLQAYIVAENSYDLARDVALKALLYQTTFSVEYDLTNVVSQPTKSTYKLIYGYRSDGGALQVTANGSTTLYNSLEGSSVSRLRSAQAAVQFDYKVAAKRKLQTTVSSGYYFQDMVAASLLTLPSTAFAPGTTIPLPGNACVLLNTAGPIHIGQGKVTLSLKGTNVSIPIAFTAASRSDLIKGSRYGGNFGISYDFSSLLSH